ncbi:sugar phosphate isomerase/epimerase family protein [Limimaricola sp. AA108-03]|uniref:sugar phosphate isomerase/epimerase family protein n=1 Tax=Limimaricola sp. AA108-03 TaxID=3425945 RepID=UPI003D773CD5
MTYPISFQLYSSRESWPLPPQLPKLKAMGYDAVEPWLPAYENDPEGLRRMLDAAGLACFGFHMPLSGLRDEPGRYVEIAQILGATYLIPPFVPEAERKDSAGFWMGIGETLAAGAEHAARHGLRVAWHNHDFEYRPLPDGSRPIEHILGQSEAVGFEIDCGWIARAGADPAEELVRYAERIVAIQPKDLRRPGDTVEGGWAATGDGTIDWAALAPLFRKTAAHHIVTEHDAPADWERFAQRSIDTLRGLGL